VAAGLSAAVDRSGRSRSGEAGEERSLGTGADFRAWLGRLCGSEDCVSIA